MSDAPRIVHCHSPSDITTEQARNARARAWAFAFECWHTKKGDLHDLTNDLPRKSTRPDKKGTQNADIYRNGL
jgi:hypothetical protein